MSLARINRVAKSRKAWTCGTCGKTISPGEPVLHFTVGFRGVERHRCSSPACFPAESERESSNTSAIYAARESALYILEGAEDESTIRDALQEVADAAEEVASEYEENPLFDHNEDLQERVELCRMIVDEIDSWDPVDCEPDVPDALKDEAFREEHAEWLAQTVSEAEDLLGELEIP